MKWMKKANPIIFENQQRLEEQSREKYSKVRHRRLLKERLLLNNDLNSESKCSFE